MDLSRLADPFAEEEIEWRIQQAGRGRSSGRIYARVLAYVTARAIQQRLDEVCGPGRWRNDFREGPGGGVLCAISIYVDDALGWVTKWDGAENTDVEGVKGGLSSSYKRAACQWAVGRYLYSLPDAWAEVREDGGHRGRLADKDGGESFRWDPPALPAWALPGGSGRRSPAKAA